MTDYKQQFEEETGMTWLNSQNEPDIDYVLWLEKKIAQRFKMPTDRQLIDIAILFSQYKGVINKVELTNMISMCQFILDRLNENNDVMIPSKSEAKD